MEFVTIEQFKKQAKDFGFPVEVLRDAVYGELENIPKLLYYQQINGEHAVIFCFTKDKTEISFTCLMDSTPIKKDFLAMPFKELSYIFVH